jgi:hypothetical protein
VVDFLLYVACGTSLLRVQHTEAALALKSLSVLVTDGAKILREDV